MSEPFELQTSEIVELPIESMSDEEVLALANHRLSDEQDDELSELLTLKREGEIDEVGKQRLNEMMRIYQIGLLHKAQGLREAVSRGLCEPLKP